jgi:hypothetical protein
MSVIDFIRELVANPEQLAQFKQDPAAYLKGTNLDSEDQEVLQKLTTSQHLLGEVSTVMRLYVLPNPPSSSSGSSLSQNASQVSISEQIDLSLLPVRLHSRAVTFLAEKTGTADLPYRLLNHSYVQIDDEKKVFSLHLCYTGPTDANDEPSMLQITTHDLPSDPEYNRADTLVWFGADEPVVIPHDTLVDAILGPGSYYDRFNGILHISIFPPTPPTGNDA